MRETWGWERTGSGWRLRDDEVVWVRARHFSFSYSKCRNDGKIKRPTVVNFSGVNKCRGIARKALYEASRCLKTRVLGNAQNAESRRVKVNTYRVSR